MWGYKGHDSHHLKMMHSVWRSCELSEAEWRIYVSVNYVTIGSYIGLSPIRRQAIIWTSGYLLSNVPLEI